MLVRFVVRINFYYIVLSLCCKPETNKIASDISIKCRKEILVRLYNLYSPLRLEFFFFSPITVVIDMLSMLGHRRGKGGTILLLSPSSKRLFHHVTHQLLRQVNSILFGKPGRQRSWPTSVPRSHLAWFWVLLFLIEQIGQEELRW